MAEEKPYRDEEVMRELYIEEELASKEVADELDCSPATVTRWLNKLDIPTRPSGFQEGEDHFTHQ